MTKVDNAQPRQLKGTRVGGQFSESVNPESTPDLGDIGDLVDARSTTPTNRENWTIKVFEVDGLEYVVARIERYDSTLEYTVIDPTMGGGWKITYDPFTRQGKASRRQPDMPFEHTDDCESRREADARHIIRSLEPDAALVDIDGMTYFVDERQDAPIDRDTLTGIQIGQMMLTRQPEEGALESVLTYVEDNRRSVDLHEQFRPDNAASAASTRRTLDGIEFAAKLGYEAAMENTVGAQLTRSH